MANYLRQFDQLNRLQSPLEKARMRNILAPSDNTMGEHQRFVRDPFEPPAPRNPFMSMAQTRRSEPERYWEEMNRMQSEVGPGVQAYRDYLKRMPQAEDYKPNWMTRIAAGLSGLSSGYREGAGEGIKTAMGINRAGYSNALSDYANEGVGLKESAELEQEELNSKLKALQAARAFGLNYDKYELSRLQAQNKMDTDTSNAESNRMRAEAYAERNLRPGFNTFPQEDGSVLYVNENDPGERHVVPAKTVQAGQLGVARGQLGVARTNAATNVRRTNIYQQDVANRAGEGAARIQQGNRALDMRESGDYFSPGTQRPPAPRAQQDAQDFALRQMMSDPAFQDFIEADEDGFPVITDDDGSQDYQDFLEALDAKMMEILRGNPTRRGGGRGIGPGR